MQIFEGALRIQDMHFNIMFPVAAKKCVFTLICLKSFRHVLRDSQSSPNRNILAAVRFFNFVLFNLFCRERSGSVVECLT